MGNEREREKRPIASYRHALRPNFLTLSLRSQRVHHFPALTRPETKPSLHRLLWAFKSKGNFRNKWQSLTMLETNPWLRSTWQIWECPTKALCSQHEQNSSYSHLGSYLWDHVTCLGQRTVSSDVFFSPSVEDGARVSPLPSQVPSTHLTISNGMNLEARADWVPEQGHVKQIRQLTHRKQSRHKNQPLVKWHFISHVIWGDFCYLNLFWLTNY